MKRIIMLLVIYSAACFAAFEKQEAGASAMAMGNALVAFPNSLPAIYYNPAALDTASAFYAQLSARNFYGFPGISQFNLVAGFRFNHIPVAMAACRFGNSKYQELQISAASAVSIVPDFSLGISMHANFLSISGYGADYTIGVNLGILYKISNNFYGGAMICNVNQPALGKSREELPQSFSLGISYVPQKKLNITAEFFRDIRYSADYRMGISYKFSYPIIIRIGLQDAVNSYCFGIGVIWKTIFFDYALQIHQILGDSHTFSISVQL